MYAWVYWMLKSAALRFILSSMSLSFAHHHLVLRKEGLLLGWH